MPDIIRGYHIRWAPYSESKPTTGWTEMVHKIRALPDMFPEPETIDVSTVDNLTPTSIPGPPAGDAYSFTVAPDPEFLTMHRAMYTDQIDTDKGYFWMQIDITNRDQRLEFPARTTQYLSTPDGNFGDLDEVSWLVYPAGDVVETVPIPATP